jgi:transcription initiation factor TFIID subunit 5
MDVSLKSEISRTNSFSYSNIVGLNSNGSLLVDQQFGKLLLFVQSQNDQQIRKDLEQLLPPLLCHLYLEILKGKEWKPAIEFLRKYSVILGQIEQAPLMPIPTQQQSSPHQRVNGTLEDPSATASNIPINYVCSYVKQQQRLLNQIHSHLHQKPSHFLPNLNPENANTFRELVRELSMLQKMQDIEFSALIANFRSSKHQVKLGLSTLPVMIDFLSKHSHVLILQTLHTWFHIDATQLDESEEEPKIRSASANPNNLSRSKNSNHNSKNSSCNNNTSNSFNDQYNYQNEMLNDFVKDEIGENLKLKRLQETFKQINSSYHMPIRIFNINNTDNR